MKSYPFSSSTEKAVPQIDCRKDTCIPDFDKQTTISLITLNKKKVHQSTQEIYKRHQKVNKKRKKEQKLPSNYLEPNQSTISNIDIEASSMDFLAQSKRRHAYDILSMPHFQISYNFFLSKWCKISTMKQLLKKEAAPPL